MDIEGELHDVGSEGVYIYAVRGCDNGKVGDGLECFLFKGWFMEWVLDVVAIWIKCSGCH